MLHLFSDVVLLHSCRCFIFDTVLLLAKAFAGLVHVRRVGLMAPGGAVPASFKVLSCWVDNPNIS